MKKLWLMGIVVVVLLAVVGLTGCTAIPTGGTGSPVTLAGLISSQPEGIWVNGTGKVTVTPDIVNLSLGVESRAATVAEAQAKAATAMKQIMDALKQNNIADKDVKTQQFSITPIYEYNKQNNQSVITGYSVSNIVNVKIRDTAKAGVVIDAVAKAGGDLTRINSIYFSVDDPTKYYDEARQKAMDDANNKAKQLARLGGVNLGKPTYITENSAMPQSIYYAKEAMAGAAPAPGVPPTSISPGETDITLNVQVTYAIVR